MVTYKELTDTQQKLSIDAAYVNEMSNNAKKRVLYNMYMKYHKQQLDEGKYDDLGEVGIIRSQIKTDTRPMKLYWVTVNPKDDVTLETFIKRVEKYTQRKMVHAFNYAFEQRGKNMDEVGKGMHVHILIKSQDKKAWFKRSTISSFTAIVGNDQAIDIKQYPMEYEVEKIEYLKGNKWDDEKIESITINKIWRERKKLKTYY